ncbi:WbqC family protein, partial [Vibrio parahaemolyticus]
LSVPLQDGRNQRKLFKDVKIDYSTSWHKQHWKSIQSVYGKSPYFEYYGETVKSLLDKKQAFLFDMNIDILNCFKKLLAIF